MSGASQRTSYSGPAHSVTRRPVSSSTSRVSPSSRLSPSSITPPGGVQSWLPLRRRFCTRSTPSSLRMSAPPTTQSRTPPSSREGGCVEPAVHPNAARVAQAAEQLGLTIELRVFPEGTRTAEEAARAVGVAVGQIVKSLVFTLDGALVMAL